ncbi:MAG: MarC family protein [Candidatus Sulfotelmatobacter sp.]
MVSALFPIVDPIGGAPVFLLLTRDYATETRRVLARRIAVDSFILMIASFTLGAHVLSFFGISLPVVQVGGGLIVIATGWAMLNQKDTSDQGSTRRTVTCADALSQAFYPLTLPLTVGPGSISVAITLGANAPQHLGANLLAILAAAIGCAFVALTIYLCYGYADRLASKIGATGTNVILKLTAFLLVCIGVQIFWNGASRLLTALPQISGIVTLPH